MKNTLFHMFGALKSLKNLLDPGSEGNPYLVDSLENHEFILKKPSFGFKAVTRRRMLYRI